MYKGWADRKNFALILRNIFMVQYLIVTGTVVFLAIAIVVSVVSVSGNCS